MKNNGDPRFRVGWLAHVRKQVRTVVQRAASVGAQAKAAAVLRSVTRLLRTDPVNWGEPLNNTLLPGGVVRMGVSEGASVRYAVYEREQAVVVLNVTLLSNAPWADP